MIAILGPTNSGKTHEAIEDLKTCTPEYPGIYLAPLRLLAAEVCDQLRKAGLRVSLVTGEEQDVDPEAQVVCSTIEMMDCNRHYFITIIDEAQMLQDEGRGWAWTRAFLQADCERLYLLGSPGIETMLRSLAKLTGESITVQHKQRITPLHLHKGPIPQSRAPKGTLFVVFSRASVIRWSELFRANGRRVSHIYGSMPPEVRRAEARRFREGETEIMIATDAVAMGLNLPAHTVILAENTKFNGKNKTTVPLPLVRQIIGRAGRFGHQEEGWCAGLNNETHRLVTQAQESADPDSWGGWIFLKPSEIWLDHIEKSGQATVKGALEQWRLFIEPFREPKLIDHLDRDTQQKASILDSKKYAAIPLREKFPILAAPVNSNGSVMKFFGTLLAHHFLGVDLPKHWSETKWIRKTEEWEDKYREAMLYAWFHYRNPDAFPDLPTAYALRDECVRQINHGIRRGLRRYCQQCGTPLPAYIPFAVCSDCMQWENYY